MARRTHAIGANTLRHWFSTGLEDLEVSKTVRRALFGHEPKDVTDDLPVKPESSVTAEQDRNCLEKGIAAKKPKRNRKLNETYVPCCSASISLRILFNKSSSG